MSTIPPEAYIGGGSIIGFLIFIIFAGLLVQGWDFMMSIITINSDNSIGKIFYLVLWAIYVGGAFYLWFKYIIFTRILNPILIF